MFYDNSRLLEISIPTILMWIGGFYLFFQVWLNILGEILRFADRHFYDVTTFLFRTGGTVRI
jgi:hypothetical protein